VLKLQNRLRRKLSVQKEFEIFLHQFEKHIRNRKLKIAENAGRKQSPARARA
jgi:hypothetical protein